MRLSVEKRKSEINIQESKDDDLKKTDIKVELNQKSEL